MPYPAKIAPYRASNVVPGWYPTNGGAFQHGSDYYLVSKDQFTGTVSFAGADYFTQLSVFKSTDEGQTWTRQDSAGQPLLPTHGGSNSGDFGVLIDGDDVVIGYGAAADPEAPHLDVVLALVKFNLGSNTWGAPDVSPYDLGLSTGPLTISKQANNSRVFQNVSIVKRAVDSAYWLAFVPDDGSLANGRVALVKYEPGWPNAAQIALSGGGYSYQNTGLTNGTGGLLHLAASGISGTGVGELFHRSLAADGVTFGTLQSVRSLPYLGLLTDQDVGQLQFGSELFIPFVERTAYSPANPVEIRAMRAASATDPVWVDEPIAAASLNGSDPPPVVAMLGGTPVCLWDDDPDLTSGSIRYSVYRGGWSVAKTFRAAEPGVIRGYGLQSRGTSSFLLVIYMLDPPLVADRLVIDAVATSGGPDTLTDSAQSWPPNGFSGYDISLTAGTGSGQTRQIGSNSADTVTVTSAWTTAPDNTTHYVINSRSLMYFDRLQLGGQVNRFRFH